MLHAASEPRPRPRFRALSIAGPVAPSPSPCMTESGVGGRGGQCPIRLDGPTKRRLFVRGAVFLGGGTSLSRARGRAMPYPARRAPSAQGGG